MGLSKKLVQKLWVLEMSKKVPLEQLILLDHQLADLNARDPKRKQLVLECAAAFGLSTSTIYRQMKNTFDKASSLRKDSDVTRICTVSEMLKYCEIIAAMKLMAKNKKNHRISTPRCLEILETSGIFVNNEKVQLPKGLLNKSTVNRYLSKWGFSDKNLSVQPVVTHFEAQHSNECWQFDFTPSDMKKIDFVPPGTKLMLALFTDDASGCISGQYVIASGEDAISALQVLYKAMEGQTKGSFIKGIPMYLYADNGSFVKSSIYIRVLKLLDITLSTHMPKSSDGRRVPARSKGKVERANRTLKDDFETLFHFQRPESLEQLNQWLHEYIRKYNEKPHRRAKCSRFQFWKDLLPESSYRAVCTKEHFAKICRVPEKRTVGSDACVSIEGELFQLLPDFAGEVVQVLHGIFDNQIYVEYQSNTFGPFYPYGGPIPFNTYKKKPKTQKEKKADYIESLSQALSLPISALSDLDNETQKILIENSFVIEELKSIPFQEADILNENYRNRIEAKQRIADILARPLASLSRHEMQYINELLDETLNKKHIGEQLKLYFSPKMVITGNLE